MARTFSVPIIGQSAASGAQVIEGSLKFDYFGMIDRLKESAKEWEEKFGGDKEE